MGAFDNSYDDDLVERHEENKLRNKYSKSLSEYTLKELQAEIKARSKKTVKNGKKK